jgi:ribosomal protein S18 acetylase RimI-like enzyme
MTAAGAAIKMGPVPGPVIDSEGIVIRRGGAERIPDLQPLWESLHEHHAAVAPHLKAIGPVRAPEQSWEVRRALYEEWLPEPDAFVLVAEDGSRPVAYALVHMRGTEETWVTGERVAELETLTVLPEYRGQGLGRALMDAVHAELRRLGISHWAVGVIATNDDAIRFYERLDLHPFVVIYLGNVPAEPGAP